MLNFVNDGHAYCLDDDNALSMDLCQASVLENISIRKMYFVNQDQCHEQRYTDSLTHHGLPDLLQYLRMAIGAWLLPITILR